MAIGMLSGAREGTLSGLRRFVSLAMARDLRGFVVPGPATARAHGLDLAKAGLPIAATPRHANVLLLLGDLPADLHDAVSITYAQMPRPRAILALGSGDLAPLPTPDVAQSLSQEGLQQGIAQIHRVFASGSFADQLEKFTAPALEVRIEYTCPMHPEVVSDKPGSCPKCGMNLVPRETGVQDSADDDAKDPHAGHDAHGGHGAHEEHGADVDEEVASYTCPMHPEVVSDKPGSCPKCGMNLVPRETGVQDSADDEAKGPHAAHDPHAGHGAHAEHGQSVSNSADDPHAGHTSGETIKGIEPQFMSMVDITKDLPRSSDGLQMDWIKVPFGPFFPGLPGGLGLDFTLDGDTVAEAEVTSHLALPSPLVNAPLSPKQFVALLEKTMPHAKVAYGLLAQLALENAAVKEVSAQTARGRIGALERERIASHLSWLADFGTQSGFGWLAMRAAALQLQLLSARTSQISALTPAISSLLSRVKKTPLLRMRLGGVGSLDAGLNTNGPIARASNEAKDLRSDNKIYVEQGFEPVTHSGADALARLLVRCDEISQSLRLVEAMGQLSSSAIAPLETGSGEGEAALETPRGEARLSLRLEKGKVIWAELETPSRLHAALIPQMTEQLELGDALAAVMSLDLAPHEMGKDMAGSTHAEGHP